MIKAIETAYQGYKFRSRLEARWAVFFDTLGIKWEYEKEGYDLDGMRYLPDFWLPELKCWIEIKGQSPTVQEEEKCQKLAKAFPFYEARPESCRIFMFVGSIPRFPEEHGRAILYGYAADVYLRVHFQQENVAWAICPNCNKCDITLDGLVDQISCECGGVLNEKFNQWPEFNQTDQKEREYEWWRQKVRSFLYTGNSPRLIAAYTAARQARFEHGEKG
jgi:hypothetical protein